jgi:hypothetical protein
VSLWSDGIADSTLQQFREDAKADFASAMVHDAVEICIDAGRVQDTAEPQL